MVGTLGFVAAILLGVVLFVLPEPVTSLLGALIIVGAVLAWLNVDLRGD